MGVVHRDSCVAGRSTAPNAVLCTAISSSRVCAVAPRGPTRGAFSPPRPRRAWGGTACGGAATAGLCAAPLTTLRGGGATAARSARGRRCGTLRGCSPRARRLRRGVCPFFVLRVGVMEPRAANHAHRGARYSLAPTLGRAGGVGEMYGDTAHHLSLPGGSRRSPQGAGLSSGTSGRSTAHGRGGWAQHCRRWACAAPRALREASTALSRAAVAAGVGRSDDGRPTQRPSWIKGWWRHCGNDFGVCAVLRSPWGSGLGRLTAGLGSRNSAHDHAGRHHSPQLASRGELRGVYLTPSCWAAPRCTVRCDGRCGCYSVHIDRLRANGVGATHSQGSI